MLLTVLWILAGLFATVALGAFIKLLSKTSDVEYFALFLVFLYVCYMGVRVAFVSLQ